MDVCDGWFVTSAVVELGYLTGPGLGNSGSNPGATGGWFNSCGWS